jgi:hypothetical protein
MQNDAQHMQNDAQHMQNDAQHMQNDAQHMQNDANTSNDVLSCTVLSSYSSVLDLNQKPKESILRDTHEGKADGKQHGAERHSNPTDGAPARGSQEASQADSIPRAQVQEHEDANRYAPARKSSPQIAGGAFDPQRQGLDASGVDHNLGVDIPSLHRPAEDLGELTAPAGGHSAHQREDTLDGACTGALLVASGGLFGGAGVVSSHVQDRKPANTHAETATSVHPCQELREVEIVATGPKSAPKRAKREPQPIECPQFAQWWARYPRKEGRISAFLAWEKTHKVRPPLADMLATLDWQKESQAWTKDAGQFIPMPTTYLNQGRWADEAPPSWSQRMASELEKTNAHFRAQGVKC